MGDNLLCSAVARELKNRGRTPIAVLTPFRELFDNNPNIETVFAADWRDVSLLKESGMPLLFPDYAIRSSNPDQILPPRGHIIGEMCRSIGITGEIELRPEYFFGRGENIPRPLNQKTVAIQCSGAGARMRCLNKEWPVDRFQSVIDRLRSNCQLIQLGSVKDPILSGVQDMRGLPLRNAASVLASCHLFIGLEGFLMHLARAVECPAVIVYGGRVAPEQTGYSCNKNLYTPLTCAPCWCDNACNYDRKCLTTISVDMVVDAAIQQFENRKDNVLAVDRLNL